MEKNKYTFYTLLSHFFGSITVLIFGWYNKWYHNLFDNPLENPIVSALLIISIFPPLLASYFYIREKEISKIAFKKNRKYFRLPLDFSILGIGIIMVYRLYYQSTELLRYIGTILLLIGLLLRFRLLLMFFVQGKENK